MERLIALVVGLVVAGSLVFWLLAPDGASPPVTNVVAVVARDTRFEVQPSVPAGLTTFRLFNEGNLMHHAQLYRVPPERGLDLALRSLEQNGAPPDWLVDLGGPNAVGPDQDASATVVLEPGEHLFVSTIPGTDGKPQWTQGLIEPFKVVARGGGAARAPRADLALTMFDYGYEFSKPVTRGRHTIRVENREVALFRFPPGRTMADVMGWIEADYDGPPPVQFLGGVVSLDPGQVNWVTLDFRLGEYGMLCFVPDRGDGRPHFAHGMAQTFRVN